MLILYNSAHHVATAEKVPVTPPLMGCLGGNDLDGCAQVETSQFMPVL